MEAQPGRRGRGRNLRKLRRIEIVLVGEAGARRTKEEGSTNDDF